MPAPVITPGNDVLVVATFYDNGNAVNFTGAIVTAALQNGQGVQFISHTAQSSSTTGADWPNGVIAVLFPRTITTGLSRGDAYLEVRADLSNGLRRTWPLIALEVQQGS